LHADGRISACEMRTGFRWFYWADALC